MYRLAYRVLLRRVPAETAHRGAFALIRAAVWIPGLAAALPPALVSDLSVL